MPTSDLKLPGKFERGKRGLQRHDVMVDWRTALIKDRIIPGFGLAESQTETGRILRVTIQGGGSGYCAFGNVTEGGTIAGGSVTAGPDVHNVAPHSVSVAADTTFLVWLSMAVTANAADGFILPGLASSSAPAWATGSSYPSQTIPTISSPTGTAIIPLGEIIVSGGAAFMAPTGCGSFSIHHCPGSLTASRS